MAKVFRSSIKLAWWTLGAVGIFIALSDQALNSIAQSIVMGQVPGTSTYLDFRDTIILSSACIAVLAILGVRVAWRTQAEYRLPRRLGKAFRAIEVVRDAPVSQVVDIPQAL